MREIGRRLKHSHTTFSRELIVNAFAHRSYRSGAPIEITFSRNSIEVANPGGLPDPLSIADFKAKCSQISDRRFNFVAGLMELPENPFDPADPAHFKGVDIENLGGGFYNTPSGTEKFECSNVLDPASDYPDIHSRDLIVRLFPVALELNADDGIQSGFAIKPMVLVVVVWRPG